MKNAFVLVFPSVLYETFGMSIIEAFACGLPVVASRLGAMAELVSDRQTGLLFEAGNSRDLAEKLSWAFTHPNDMAYMAAAARTAYLKYYTAQRGYSMLESVYRRVLPDFLPDVNSSA
jgi:glycosyltransferase involved in cell wall biosynthesis